MGKSYKDNIGGYQQEDKEKPIGEAVFKYIEYLGDSYDKNKAFVYESNVCCFMMNHEDTRESIREAMEELSTEEENNSIIFPMMSCSESAYVSGESEELFKGLIEECKSVLLDKGYERLADHVDYPYDITYVRPRMYIEHRAIMQSNNIEEGSK